MAAKADWGGSISWPSSATFSAAERSTRPLADADGFDAGVYMRIPAEVNDGRSVLRMRVRPQGAAATRALRVRPRAVPTPLR